MEKIPEFDDEVEMNRLKIICGEAYVLSLTSRNKKELPMPSSLMSALNAFVAAGTGIHLRERRVPFLLANTQDLCANVDPPTLIDENVDAPLAIVDFGRRDCCTWKVEELAHFFRWLARYSRCKVICVAVFV